MSVFYNNLEQTVVSYTMTLKMSLTTESNLRIFPGSYEKTSVFQGIPGLERKIQKFKGFQVFQVTYKPCSDVDQLIGSDDEASGQEWTINFDEIIATRERSRLSVMPIFVNNDDCFVQVGRV